jgi:hypothetical protein
LPFNYLIHSCSNERPYTAEIDIPRVLFCTCIDFPGKYYLPKNASFQEFRLTSLLQLKVMLEESMLEESRGRGRPDTYVSRSFDNQLSITIYEGPTRIGLAMNDIKQFELIQPLAESDPAFDAIQMHQMSTTELSYRRIFAIFLTFTIELVVAFVISLFTTTRQTYPLLTVFMPVISTVSGNVGLQSSSIMMRTIDLGLYSVNDAVHAIRREIEAALIFGLSMGLFTGVIAGLWQQWAVFGCVLWISLLLSIMMASMTEIPAPFIGKAFHIDAATIAGMMNEL